MVSVRYPKESQSGEEQIILEQNGIETGNLKPLLKPPGRARRDVAVTL